MSRQIDAIYSIRRTLVFAECEVAIGMRDKDVKLAIDAVGAKAAA